MAGHMDIEWSRLLGIGGDLTVSVNDLRDKLLNGREPSLRSVAWKILLVFKSTDISSWKDTLHRNREIYNVLKDRYLGSEGQIVDQKKHQNDTVQDPLSDTPPVITQERSIAPNLEELKREIMQDVERTFPDIEYFRDSRVQQSLLRILLIYSLLNPDVSYKQGMHEILAPLFWIVDFDSVKEPDQGLNKDQEYVLLPEFIEHDAFELFRAVMANAKAWYENGPSNVMSPIAEKSQRIQDILLRSVDPLLVEKLEELEIEPQIWGIRWIRLIFGREFGFFQLFPLWDAIFACDADTLDIIDYVCVALIVAIKPQLINADYSTAVTLLLKYPMPPGTIPSYFVRQACYIRDMRLESDRMDGSPRTSGTFKLPNNLHSFMNSPGKNVFNVDSIRDIAKAVGKNVQNRSEGMNKLFPDSIRRNGSRSRISNQSLKDELTQRQNEVDFLLEHQKRLCERETKLAEILNQAEIKLKANPRTNEDAYNKIELVRKCLLDANHPIIQQDDSETTDKEPIKEKNQESHELAARSNASTPFKSSPARVSLVQSEFSWMLGEKKAPIPSTRLRANHNNSRDIDLESLS